ncbi:MAG: HEAT repeat domain-containing protein [Planctomycetes bacterium]|nr:HEAT repeat domain-containing protein [Planctomycetota bacterium]
MGISDTIACLCRMPPAAQLELCTTALGEPNAAVQCAASRLLVDPTALARPDIVVDHFGELMPAAVTSLREWQRELMPTARERIVSCRPDRLAAYQLVAAIGGDGGLGLLEYGVEDADGEVRAVVLAAIDGRLREFAAAARSSAADGPLPRPEEALWQAAEAVLRGFSRHRRGEFVTLLGEFGQKAVPLINRALKTQNGPEFAYAVTGALGETSAVAAAELAFALVQHKSEPVRMIGELVLEQRQDAAFLAAYLACIGALDGERRRALAVSGWLARVAARCAILAVEPALLLLRLVADEVSDPVLAQRSIEPFVDHAETEVQLAALARLRELRCPGGCAMLGKVIATAAGPACRLAAEIVVELAPPDRAALLMPLLGAAEPALRQIGMRGVVDGSFDRFMRKFDGMDQKMRETAARALAKIDPGFVDRLGEEFISIEASRRLKALKVVELVQAGGDLREPLLEMLDDPDLRVRATAIRIIEVSGSVDGIKVLIDALAHPDRRVRANAVEAVEQLENATYIDLLRPFLRDRDNRVRANAAKALWNLGWADASDVLVAMVAHDDPRMRVSAIWAVSEVRFPGARELLEKREMMENNPAVLAKVREALAAYDSAQEEVR